MLRFLLQSPHGYHVEMASQTPFVYGDEDTVMACLTKVQSIIMILEIKKMKNFVEGTISRYGKWGLFNKTTSSKL